MAEPPARSRVRARAACDECRRRKLRCDGRQPRCGVCEESDTICETTERGSRGPKKGYIQDLKDRVAYLESLLGNQLEEHHAESPGERDTDLSTPRTETLEGSPRDAIHAWTSTAVASATAPELLIPNTSMGMLPGSSWTPENFPLSPTIRTELDQLYFDRVHASIPMLQHRRYISWARADPKPPPRKALQLVMWALATLMSTQFRDLTEGIYCEAKQTLQRIPLEEGGAQGYETDLAQAWILLAIFESMRTYYRQACMTATQAFHLVQGLRFHEIDDTRMDRTRSNETESMVQREEKRRAFWVAYLLDHILSVRNDWPVTLNEHVVCTRLPSPDSEFQSSQPLPGDFLSEAMTEPAPSFRSPFTECLIWITLCGRIMLLNREQSILATYGDSVVDLSQQRQWLDELLANRAHALSQLYPPPSETYDPLLLFANVLSQTAIAYWCNGLMQQQVNPVSHEYLSYQYRVLSAVRQICYLAQILSNLHFSKLHPLMPLPLLLIAELVCYHRTIPAFALLSQEVTNVYSRLQNRSIPIRDNGMCGALTMNAMRSTVESEPSQGVIRGALQNLIHIDSYLTWMGILIAFHEQSMKITVDWNVFGGGSQGWTRADPTSFEIVGIHALLSRDGMIVQRSLQPHDPPLSRITMH
ncbi:hypothetical protein N7492_004097 [Penicillium capsulatum]|uniref:Zn(2)-C6 fungal-type domain-containing protein n=1 Tax=Penicillium capsulatum TaxID=69766 RepID=A0A9W9IN70_9EURO|nr:hypothetical protein N7492_004097 [Penicillium capsulatum]KAJ6121330.1 hypothetical protein N7512_003795 [Penicillium capsulatum]